MPALNAGELLFSIIFSYMGALEFFFIARNLYHWGFKHHRRMIELNDDSNSLHELQEQIKAAISEAKEKELYGLNAMKDGVLYKEGFRVSPNKENTTDGRHVIGSSRNSVERKHDSKTPEPSNDNLKTVTARSILTPEKQQNSSQEKREEVIEEPCIKKEIKIDLQSKSSKITSAADDDTRTNLTQTIKTQFGQTSSTTEQYSLKSSSDTSKTDRPTLMPGKSDDSSSTEPPSTHKSDFSNQQSSSLETTLSIPEMRIDESERPEPDGQDVNEPSHFSDEYLRSLDGVKNRPLVRDDGTGRRRAFKKRRSSGDSTSSRESRASREEELKMFTSLEEEEFAAIKRGESEYAPIRYSSEPNLKVDKHSKRHKRSPVKGLKDSDELDKETGSPPWGDIKPEHYKDMEFWKREKTISIEEEAEDYSEQDQSLKTGRLMTKRSVSPSPVKNVPQTSSFEEATKSEHEFVVSALKRDDDAQKPSEKEKKDDTSDEKPKNVSTSSQDDDSLNSTSLPSSAYDTHASALPSSINKSFETDENVVHDQRTDEIIERSSPKLRKSPRQDDMELYEEQFIEEERRASRTPSPNQNKSSTSIGLDHENTQESILSQNIDTEINETESHLTSSQSAPTIEIDFAPDQEIQINYEEESEDEHEHEEPNSGLMEGISDFYDFNASINPSRSPSRSGSRSRSKSQSRPQERASKSPFTKPINIKSREPSPYQKQLKSKKPSVFNAAIGIPGVSDWYDYNVMLNRKAYGIPAPGERKTHYSTTDFLVDHLQDVNNIRKENINYINTLKNEVIRNRSKSKERSQTPEIKIGCDDQDSEILNQDQKEKYISPLHIIPQRSTETSPENSPQQSPIYSPNEIPETPQYPRSFSAEWKDTERIKDDYKENFKRSTYVGESVDFSDDFEELREQTRNFKRSRSKSRSPTHQDVENIQFGKMTARHKLQEKILAQITKTTLDYQDFAKDLSHEFLDHERRGSDSALIQKSEILIQFQDNQLASKNNYFEDFDDIELEAEEYHHFRRFSIQQEEPTENYPEDEYFYEYQEVDLNQDKWINAEQLENNFTSEQQIQEISSTSNEVIEDLLDKNQQNNDDFEEDGGSSSEDERQTVIEVEDEIDEDISYYEKSDEFNEQSECEEADREVDKYINRSAKDWKEEGAVGGVLDWRDEQSERRFHENDSNIKELYDDALKYIEEDGIEKDYENIVEAMNKEERFSRQRGNDGVSAKTEDLIDEILKEDEKKYNSLSPRSYRSSSRTSSQNFIDHEKESSMEYYITTSTVIHHNTASTRLRSRYGLPPSTTYRTYDYEEDVDLNYKPKKEYNWRKNFKIDDDNGQNNNNTQNERLETNGEEEFNEEYHENIHELLDTRKYSLGGESITLYSRSLDSEEKQLEIVNDDEILNSKENNEQNGITNQEIITEEINDSTVVIENDKIDVLSKKKKSKKKSRKGSKASLDDEESLNNFTGKKLRKASKASIGGDEEDLNNFIEINNGQTDSSSKKKSKKKKKIKVDINSENVSPDIKSPEPEPIENEITLPPKNLEIQQQRKTSEQNLPLLSNSQEAKVETSPSKTLLDGAKSSSPKPENVNSLSEPSSSKLPSKSPERKTIIEQPTTSIVTEPQKNKPPLERQDSSGVYELIKDGSMYPWF